ncbi:MAG: NusG domain II-containing protein [Oscillospiraceae bacterium]|nr:NusG domain II-containing protein [Oscillospiraceae bacterium]
MFKHLKNDLILLAAIIAIALGLFWVEKSRTFQDGTTVVITLSGETYAEVSLSGSKKVEIPVEGLLTVVIDGGEVYVTDSTCPDGLCERSGAISKSGESIVCLPNGVVVKITSDEPEYDFIN